MVKKVLIKQFKTINIISNLQALLVNDVKLPDEERFLLFDKHIEYIANHGNDKNDYVKFKLNKKKTCRKDY